MDRRAAENESIVIVNGTEIPVELVAGRLHAAKMVFNDHALIAFHTRHQHRDMKSEGISYDEIFEGDAMAAMLRRDASEIRFHREFDDGAVGRMVGKLHSLPELAFLARAHIMYQVPRVTV